jgi:lipopolysaccharide export system permease protein
MRSIIARYVTRLLLGRFALVLLGLAALMLLLEFLADSDQVIAASDHPVRALALYMALRLPDLLGEVIPVAALLAGLLAFAELARHSELTALYAGGMSKATLAFALLPAVVLIAGFQFLIEDQARPAALQELRAWGVGDYQASDEPDPIWLRRGADIVRIEAIDAGQAELRGVTIFRRDADGNLVAKIDALRAVFDGGSWTLYDVIRSELASASVVRLERTSWTADVAPGDLDILVTNPAEMPLRELLRVVGHPELGSQPAYRYATWLHERIAAPVTTAMLLLLTVAIARPPRGRATQGTLIAAGIGGGFLLWTFDNLILSFGDLGLVPPLLAAWTPVPVIAAIAGSIVLHDHAAKRRQQVSGDRGPGPRMVYAADGH